MDGALREVRVWRGLSRRAAAKLSGLSGASSESRRADMDLRATDAAGVRAPESQQRSLASRGPIEFHQAGNGASR